MCKRECEDSKQLKTKEVFAGSLREVFPWSEACARHMIGMWGVMTDGFHKCLASKAFPRDIHKTFYFANLLYLIHPLYPHYIYPHYTHMLRSAFQRENPSHYSWEWEIIIPTILYTIHCSFPQLLPLHFQILERLLAKHLPLSS